MTVLCSKTINVLRKALVQGLKDRRVIETNLFDWEEKLRPEVIAQLTADMIQAQLKSSKSVVTSEVRQYLAKFDLSLKGE